MTDYTINDSMAEMYLYETNSLLEELDQILLGAEKSNEFNDEEINSIFRIMHTIKGSSAMMEYEEIAKVAHLVEDLFSHIRTNGIDSAHNEALCNVTFQANDFLKGEVEKIENGDPLNKDIAFLETSINNFLKLLKGIAVSEVKPAAVVTPVTTEVHDDVADAVAKADKVTGESTIIIRFDEGCQMENIRAMILVSKIKELCADITYEPSELVENDSATQQILNDGFKVILSKDCPLDNVVQMLGNALNIKYFMVNGVRQNGGRQINDTIKIRVFFEDDCQMENMRAYMLVQQISEAYPRIQYSPENLEVGEESTQQIINEGLLLSINDSDRVDDVVGIVEQGLHVKYYEIEAAEAVKPVVEPQHDVAEPVVAQETDVKTPVVAAASLSKDKPATAPVVVDDGAHNKGVKQSLISVNLNKLDMLMNIVGEIVITESMVTASPDLLDLELENFTKAARQLRKLTDELQDIAMSIRMVSVAGVFQKMNRIVRDMNKKLDKEVELVLIGEETEVDKTIVDGIADPLMHLVRNSMDHGIESIEQRQAVGKPPHGKIILSAQNTGGEIVITVQDDGKGLDKDSILRKAQERGLLTKNESDYSEREIYLLLMLPGFSTKEQVTEFSGRGVGMDVVKKNIEKVGGNVQIESKLGQGMATIFKIPLTLAIMDAMEISVGTEIFTIPINAIRQSFKARREDIIEDINGNQMVIIRGECFSVINLYQIYGLATEVTDIEEGILIQVEINGKAACIFADKLLGQYQVVVKPLPLYLNTYNVRNYGITGCTILGDGSISLILEIANLLK